ncbi:MAG: AbrB/MazE/SpoVT family DNA-binding domain-containing protein [Planctomycetes bacterium]|nr:AbrB/MazE/SpoVT family DNA-binding domain-containing protein [Planctomycetota bacterium]
MQTVVLKIEQIGDEGYAPLPRDLLERLGMKIGDAVEIRIEDGKLILEKIADRGINLN